MEAVTPPAMPSQAQMAYAQRTTNLHRTSHAQPSSDANTSPYKPRLNLPSPSAHPYGAPPNSVRFVSHFAASAGQLHYRPPPYNAHMIVRENLPPPGTRIDSSPSASQIRTRIPLLAAQPYLTSPAHGNEHGGLVISLPSIDLNPPAKKLRLSDGPGGLGLLKADLIQPLRIETRDHSQNTVLNSGSGAGGGGGPGSVYNPQVEAISPTLPPDPVKEDTTLKTVKDELIGKIGKVDKDITQTDALVNELKEKEKALEETLKRLQEEQKTVKADPPKQSLAQLVYKRNRELAEQAHAQMQRLGPPIDLPIYNQPMDTAVFQQNRERHVEFRPRLVELIRKRKQEETARQTKLTDTYCSLAAQWFKKVEKIENSNKRKSREQKSREVYEKMFPEIRKNREDKERFSRVGARVKSDADLAEIMDGLQEQEAEDRRRHSLSVIPPIICDASGPGRAPRFLNNNGRVLDYAGEMEARAQAKMWTPQERELFRDKYIHHQKNFGLIASFLERKTPSDCVEYYYLSKKRENYKRAIRYNKSRARTRGNKNIGKGAAVNALNNPLPLLDPIFNTAGVTTRLQREALIKQEVVGPGSGGSRASGKPGSESNTPVKEEPTVPAPVHHRRGVTPIPTTTATPTSSSTPSVTCDTPSSSLSSNTPTTTTTTSLPSTSSTVTTSSSSQSIASTASTNSQSSSSSAVTAVVSSSSQQGHPSIPVSIATVTSAVTFVTNSLLLNELSGGSGSHNANNVHSNSSTGLPPGSTHNTSSSHFASQSVRKLGGPQQGTMPPTSVPMLNHHHYNSTGELRLEIKKKERRKEDKKKDGEFLDDTSDDEVVDNQELDKLRSPHECHICRKLVTASRRLPRTHATQYGLTEDQVPGEARVCAACRLRHRFTCCPIPSCVNHTTQRAKRLRQLPSKFHSLPPQLKSTLSAEFQITPSITKCCSLCYTRVQKRLMTMGIEDPSSRPVSPSSGSTSPLLRWTEEETEMLKKGLRECGTKWTAVSSIVGPSKTSHQCKSFYFSYRKSLGLDLLVQEYNKNHFGTERKPALTDEEESGSSTSSCDGLLGSGVGGAGGLNIDSDTTSAPSPSTGGPKPSPLCPPRVSESSDTRPPSNQAPPTREDYDSSATETADESTAEHPGNTNSPLTVKDLMLGVIEISLKNSQGGSHSADPNSSGSTKSNPPTISSILKSSESTGAPPSLPPPPPTLQSKPISMVQQQREAEPVTLDLSIKKPRGSEPSYPPSSKPLALPHTVMYRSAPDTSPYYHQGPPGPGGEVYGAPVSHLVMTGPPHRPPTPSHMKPNKVRITSLSPGQHPSNHRLSPSQQAAKLSSGHASSPRQYQDLHSGGLSIKDLHSGHSMKDLHSGHSMKDLHSGHSMKDLHSGHSIKDLHSSGHSIKDLHSGGHSMKDIHMKDLHAGSHGMKESPGGSITQGTPVHSRLYGSERGGAPPPEFYGKPSPSSSAGPNPAHRSSESHPQPRSSSNPPPLPSSSSSSPFYPPRTPSYASSSAEQQQILMNDYLTAKQMHGSPSPGPPRNKSTPPSQQAPPPQASNPGPPPPPSPAAMFYQPTRQGVIQRHNTSKPPSPHFPPPPGHEAFSSLVETAVRQPSLPVPGEHKSERDRLQSLHHEGLGQRFNNNHDRYPPPSSREQQERFARESAQQQQREREMLAAREQQLMAARDRELQQLRDQAILREQHIRELQIREQQQKQMIRDNQLLQQQQRERELMHLRERELMAEHMAARSRLNSEQQARIHQMQMAAFQQQQQHHHHAAAVAAAHQQVAAAQREHQAQQQGGGGSKASSVSSSGGGSTGSDKHAAAEARPQLVTAASLIDAIITHQINQPVDQAGPGPGERGHLPPTQPGLMNQTSQATRPGDRLFQVDFNQKKVSVSPLDTIPGGAPNGKVSPASSLPPGLLSRGGKLHSPDPPSKPGPGPPGMMSINEQIESMISRSTAHAPSMYEQQAWKLRRALQAKEEEAHRKQASPGSRYYEPVPMSPLDYVKNRIAEVMRTSEEDKADREEHTPPPRSIYSPHAAPSPYSLMQSSPRSHHAPPHQPPHHHDPGKPLMSDQYDALSDDD